MALFGLGIEIGWEWGLAGLIVLPIVIALALRTLVAATRLRRTISLVVRILLVLLLVGALAMLRTHRNAKGICVTFLLDLSASVERAQIEHAVRSIEAALEEMASEDRFALIAFADGAAVERPPGPKGKLPKTFSATVNREQTDLAAAIRLGLALTPPHLQKRMVLLTDGNETRSRAATEAAVAAAQGVDIDVIPLKRPAQRRAETWLEEPVLPRTLRKDEPFAIKLVVHSDVKQSSGVEVICNGESVGSFRTDLTPGANYLELPQRLTHPGFYRYEVRVSPSARDGFLANNRVFGYTQVGGRRRVLYIEGEVKRSDLLANALIRQGITVEVGGPAKLPPDLPAMLAYDCIILSNVNRYALSEGQMTGLARYVEDFGGGFLWLGGPESFGPGGYRNTPVARISPVEVDIRRQRQLPGMALMIVIDCSGSMGAPAGGGHTKMDLANNAAAESLKNLTDRDQANVLMVDTRAKWVGPAERLLAMTPSNRRMLIKKVLGGRPGGGGIYVRTGLTHAYETLLKTNAQLRHIILFSDARDSEEQSGCAELVATHRVPPDNVTLSVIGLGTPGDPHVGFLHRLSEVIGGGRMVITNDARQLPRLFARETFLAMTHPFVEKPDGFVPAVAGYASNLKGVIEQGLPPLLGYVITSPKPKANLLLVGTEPDHPILAQWQRGLGRTVAFTSDAGGNWSRQWVKWPEFAAFWAQMVRWARRDQTAGPFESVVNLAGGEGRIALDALDADGQPINHLKLRARITSPNPSRPTENVRIEQVGPGRYEARFTAREPGAYMVSMIQKKGDRLRVVDATGAVMSYSPEYRRFRTNTPLLKRICEITGGKIRHNANLSGIFNPKARTIWVRRGIWQSLLWLSAVLLVLDIATRRFVIPEALSDWVRSWGRTPAPAATMTRLHQARARIKTEPDPPLPEVDIVSPAGPLPVSPVAKPRPEPKPDSGPDYTSRLLEAKRRARVSEK